MDQRRGIHERRLELIASRLAVPERTALRCCAARHPAMTLSPGVRPPAGAHTPDEAQAYQIDTLAADAAAGTPAVTIVNRRNSLPPQRAYRRLPMRRSGAVTRQDSEAFSLSTRPI